MMAFLVRNTILRYEVLNNCNDNKYNCYKNACVVSLALSEKKRDDIWISVMDEVKAKYFK